MPLTRLIIATLTLFNWHLTATADLQATQRLEATWATATDLDGEVVRELHQSRLADSIPIGGVAKGPRQVDWLHTTQHALGQRFDDISTFDERRHRDTVTRFAVDLRNDEVLGDIDEAPVIRGFNSPSQISSFFLSMRKSSSKYPR